MGGVKGNLSPPLLLASVQIDNHREGAIRRCGGHFQTVQNLYGQTITPRTSVLSGEKEVVRSDVGGVSLDIASSLDSLTSSGPASKRVGDISGKGRVELGTSDVGVNRLCRHRNVLGPTHSVVYHYRGRRCTIVVGEGEPVEGLY